MPVNNPPTIRPASVRRTMVTGSQRSITERPKDMSFWYAPAMAAPGDGQRFFVPTTGEQRPDAVTAHTCVDVSGTG